MLTKEGVYALLIKKHAGENLPDGWEAEIFQTIQAYTIFLENSLMAKEKIDNEITEVREILKIFKNGMVGLRK